MFIALFGIKFRFKGNLFAGFVSGSIDEVKCWSDDAILKADLERKMLENCYPPSAHFTEKGYMEAIKQLGKRNPDGVRAALESSVLEKADPNCVILLTKIALEIISGCPKILSEALPMTYY